MAATRLIPLHENKGKTVAKCLKDRTDYVKNGEKTNEGEFISSYECNPEIVDQEFYSSRQEYLKQHRAAKHDVIAYQIRQSFKPGEITPEEANEIGYELAMKFTKGQHAFIVATHTDRAHIHNHIVFNSINLSSNRKFRDFYFSGLALQKISDQLCLEHGLSVIKPKPYSEREKKSYPKRNSKTFQNGYRKVDMLIDIQKKMAEGKGEGYRRWARTFNVKTMAKVLLFLQEHDIRDIETLRQKADEASDRFNELSDRIKSADKRLDEIKALKMHIINYGRTKEIYAAYRNSGYSKKFYEEHRADIITHKEAKEAFSALDAKKLPKIKELNQEYGEVLAGKLEAYREYRKVKQDMKDLVTARYDVERFLKLQETENHENHEKDKRDKDGER